MKILIRSLLYIDDNPNRDDSEIQEIPATARIYGEILLILQGIRLLWEGGTTFMGRGNDLWVDVFKK